MVNEMKSNEIFETIRIPNNIQDGVKQSVIKKLGVENQFKLNDRFEGVYYMNKQLKRILSLYVVEKIFNLKLIDKENILKSKSFFENNGVTYGVVGVEFGAKIIIPKINVDVFLIVGFFDFYNKGKYLGGIKYDDCIKENNPQETNSYVASKDILSVIKKESLNPIVNV